MHGERIWLLLSILVFLLKERRALVVEVLSVSALCTVASTPLTATDTRAGQLANGCFHNMAKHGTWALC